MIAKIDKRGRAHNSTMSGVSYHRVQAFFKKYDVNGDGSIDLEEFGQMLFDLGLKELHPEDIAGLFGRFDKNGDGDIDKDEFAEFFTGSFEAGVTADGQTQNSECAAAPSHLRVRFANSLRPFPPPLAAIIDMPCTKDSISSQFKSARQLKHELKVEFKIAMDRQGKKIRAEFLKLCEEGRPGVRAIKKHVLNVLLRDTFSIGIGRQKAVQMLVDEIQQAADGCITWKEFCRTFKQVRRW
jgi:Ca2+-binding EF-hand superfamily protein